MNESPQSQFPARNDLHKPNTTHAPGAQAVADVQVIATVVSRAPGHTVPTLYVALPDGTQLYICDLPLRVTSDAELPMLIMPKSQPECIRWNIAAALTLHQRRMNRERVDDLPTTTDGDPMGGRLTNESVLEEIAESQERAHAQLYGGAR